MILLSRRNPPQVKAVSGDERNLKLGVGKWLLEGVSDP